MSNLIDSAFFILRLVYAFQHWSCTRLYVEQPIIIIPAHLAQASSKINSLLYIPQSECRRDVPREVLFLQCQESKLLDKLLCLFPFIWPDTSAPDTDIHKCFQEGALYTLAEQRVSMWMSHTEQYFVWPRFANASYMLVLWEGRALHVFETPMSCIPHELGESGSVRRQWRQLACWHRIVHYKA